MDIRGLNDIGSKPWNRSAIVVPQAFKSTITDGQAGAVISYTVPASKVALINGGSISMACRVVGTAGTYAYVTYRIIPVAGGSYDVGGVTLGSDIAGASSACPLPAGGYLLAGDTINIAYAVLAGGGDFFFVAGYHLLVFDA